MTLNREVEFDFIRIISIILIVFSHIIRFDDQILNLLIISLGIIGNGAFFFISGYLIHLNNQKIESITDIISFYRKRVLRIFPLYWIALIVSIIVFTNYNYTPLFVAGHFLGIQMIIYPKFIATNISPFWFIGMLLIYYLIYPILIFLKANTPKKMLILSTLFFILLVAIKLITGFFGGSIFEYYYIFIAGILVNQMTLFTYILNDKFKYLYYISPVVVFLVLYFSATCNLMMDDKISPITLNVIIYVVGTVILRWVLIFSSILCMYYSFKLLLSDSNSLIPYVMMGSVSSYAIFLFHKPFFYYFQDLLDVLNIQNIIVYNSIQVVIGIPLVFLMCYYITTYFDFMTERISGWFQTKTLKTI